MNSIFMSVDITTYGIDSMKPICTFSEIVDGGEVMIRHISYEQALRLMWELVLAGGEKTMEVSRYDPTITYRHVSYWARH